MKPSKALQLPVEDSRKWRAPFLPQLPARLEMSEGNACPAPEIQLHWAELLQAYRWHADRYGRTFAQSDFRAAIDVFHQLEQSLKSWRLRDS